MLEITLAGAEYYDEVNSEFVYEEGSVIKLEHSLVSLSKWESKWEKPFIGNGDKTNEEILDYVQCMVIDGTTDIANKLSEEDTKRINDYIDAKMSATMINDNSKSGGREVITSEVIYHWMISLNIPFECQYWHLNRLMMLIRVCSIKNNPPKKMSKKETLSRNAQLNAARKKQLGTKG